MSKIEVLFPEICDLYGDLYNIKYLSKCIKNAEVIYTSIEDEPYFAKEDVDMIYMGPMTEKSQEIVIEKIKPYIGRINELVEQKKIFLFTGNAGEILGKYIETDDNKKIECLNILDFFTKRHMMGRINSLILADFKEMKIVGYKSQFTTWHGNNESNHLFRVIRGIGINKETKLEGFRINNLFVTQLLGPLLVINPFFTKYILKLLGEDETLEFEDEAIKAYNIRLKEFEDENTKL